MGIFLSKENQKLTVPLYSITLCWIPNDNWLDIITLYSSKDREEYYLFNKIKIWTKKI